MSVYPEYIQTFLTGKNRIPQAEQVVKAYYEDKDITHTPDTEESFKDYFYGWSRGFQFKQGSGWDLSEDHF